MSENANEAVFLEDDFTNGIMAAIDSGIEYGFGSDEGKKAASAAKELSMGVSEIAKIRDESARLEMEQKKMESELEIERLRFDLERAKFEEDIRIENEKLAIEQAKFQSERKSRFWDTLLGKMIAPLIGAGVGGLVQYAISKNTIAYNEKEAELNRIHDQKKLDEVLDFEGEGYITRSKVLSITADKKTLDSCKLTVR